METKADWLRSEIEKLDGNKRKSIAVMSPDEIVSDALKFKRHPNQAFNDGHATGYNQALTSIITRYKEELKVLEKTNE